MLQALYERGIEPDLIVASSVGALNGAFIASRPQAPETADELAQVWRGIGRGQVFPLNPLTGFFGFFGLKDHLVPDGSLRWIIGDQVDFERLEAAPIPLHVIATDALSGGPRKASSGAGDVRGEQHACDHAGEHEGQQTGVASPDRRSPGVLSSACRPNRAPEEDEGGDQREAAGCNRDSDVSKYACRDSEHPEVPQHRLRAKQLIGRCCEGALSTDQQELREEADQKQVGDEPDRVLVGHDDPARRCQAGSDQPKPCSLG